MRITAARARRASAAVRWVGGRRGAVVRTLAREAERALERREAGDGLIRVALAKAVCAPETCERASVASRARQVGCAWVRTPSEEAGRVLDGTVHLVAADCSGRNALGTLDGGRDWDLPVVEPTLSDCVMNGCRMIWCTADCLPGVSLNSSPAQPSHVP